MGAPENFEYSFKEIAALPRQAELSLTWDRLQSKLTTITNPSSPIPFYTDESALCFYVVQIRGITPDVGCEMTDDVTIWIDKVFS